MKKNARLFIDLEGPVIGTDGKWVDNLFPVLHSISCSGIYELYLIEGDDGTVALLSHQGIPLESVTRSALERMDGNTDWNHSHIITSNRDLYEAFERTTLLEFTDWKELESRLLAGKSTSLRRATAKRGTKETSITLSLDIDGSGDADIVTGLPFFDHMLDQIARHARFDITLKCTGDLEVDEHHTVEDVALVLGKTIGEALGDKRGIGRYGFMLLPMDECLAEVALDFSGRPWFVWDVDFSRQTVGTFPTELFSHFFKSFSDEAKCNLHMKVNGGNAHHQAEALFKAFARALRMAVFRYPGNDDLPSTKGVL
jgi:imidazoleglycerol-phosphate dehydratase/histidinol-phosphatase